MKITIIGAGNMGGAIARGLVKSGFSNPTDITCTARTSLHLDSLKKLGINTMTNNVTAIKSADIVILAVKPWLMRPVMEEIRECIDCSRQIITSVAAGITFASIEEILGKGSFFRIMPNVAVEVLSSMTFVSSYNASAEQEKIVMDIFNALGSTMLIKEEQMAAATILASCGIAYAMRYVRAASEGGVQLGFYPNQAKEIVLQTVKGAIDVLITTGEHPEAAIDRVTTPGGITIKGLNNMEAAGFTNAVLDGLLIK